MSARKLKVVLTRRLPDAVETRMRELFDAELNLKDQPMERAALQAAVQRAEVLVPTITDIIDAERHVPTVVHGVAHRIAADGRRTALVEARINNPVDTNEDSYSLGGRPRVTMNLNREPRGGLRRLVGVTAAVAARIDTERTANAIRDRDDFMARPALGPVLWHQLVSTAGIRVRFR